MLKSFLSEFSDDISSNGIDGQSVYLFEFYIPTQILIVLVFVSL